jgi:hypothetical protein
MTTVPKVTREVLESYLHCKSKGLLKLAREHGTKSDYEVWHLDLTARQQSGAVGNLTTRYRGYKVGADVALTVPNMTNAYWRAVDSRLRSTCAGLDCRR